MRTGARPSLPNGIPDEHEFYLLERVLQEGAALVTEAQATETAVAFYRNQVILKAKLGARVTAQELNALAAYATLGDAGGDRHTFFIPAGMEDGFCRQSTVHIPRLVRPAVWIRYRPSHPTQTREKPDRRTMIPRQSSDPARPREGRG